MSFRKTLAVLVTVLLLLATSLLAFAEEQGNAGDAADGAVATEAAAGEAGKISVKVHHLLLSPNDDRTLNVKEQLVIYNPGEALPEGKTVTITLPLGYRELELFHDLNEDMVQVEEDSVIIKQLPAGETMIGFSYVMETFSEGTAPHFIISETVNYPTQSYFVLAPAQGMKIISSELQSGGVQNMGGMQYQFHAADNVKPGTKMEIRAIISMADESAGGQDNSGGYSGTVTREAPKFHTPGHIRFWKQSPFAGMDAHLFLFLVIVVPAGAIGYALYRRTQEAAELATEADEEEELFQRLVKKQKVLMNKLKELEIQHANGEVDEETYTQLREIYKKKLVKVKAKLKELAG